MPGDAQDGAIVISRGWLAICGSLAAVAMALGSWGVSQSTSRGTMALQLETLERRLDAMDTRTEARRTSIEATWRGFEERLANLSDRLARVEVRLDTGAGIDQRRNRTGLECWQNNLPFGPVPAVIKGTLP
jgi:uncharacterized membrane-anchored protein